MRKSVVYRVQDKQGRAPFRPGLTLKWLQMDKGLPPYFIEFPDLDLNEDARFGEVFGCACREPEQLKKWFTEGEYRTLRKLGFRAVVLEVDRIIKGSENQCVFARSRALRKGATEFVLY